MSHPAASFIGEQSKVVSTSIVIGATLFVPPSSLRNSLIKQQGGPDQDHVQWPNFRSADQCHSFFGLVINKVGTLARQKKEVLHVPDQRTSIR